MNVNLTSCKVHLLSHRAIPIPFKYDKRQASVDRIMADTAMSEQPGLTPCSNEERQRIECQTRMETQARFGYWSLYRYASSVEIAGMVLCTISAIGAGVVTPLMTVCSPSSNDSTSVALNKHRLSLAIYQVPLWEWRANHLSRPKISVSCVAIRYTLYTSVGCDHTGMSADIEWNSKLTMNLY
jgi:hypothetical protein